MASPSSGPHYNLWTDARQSTVSMTVTFVGTASFTVDGTNTTSITSGVPTTVPIHTGITAIVITQNDGSVETPYYVDINRGWLITGFEIYNADDDSVVYSRRVADNNFDPLSTQTYNVRLPYNVSRIKWAIFYDPITEPSATTSPQSLGAWVGFAAGFAGGPQSGKKSDAQTVGTGGTFPIITQINGPNFGYPWTTWPVNITRGTAYTSQSLSSVTFDGVDDFRAKDDQLYTWLGYVQAEKPSAKFTATFATGTTSYTVNDGAPEPVTSGTAVSIPMVPGTYDVVLTHEAPGGAKTTYTYKLAHGIPITGFEVADWDTGVVLANFTGENFDVNNFQYYVVAPNSVSKYKIRLFFDVPQGYDYSSWVGGISNCQENGCQPGEWSDSFTIGEGGSVNGGPLVMCNIATVCRYGNWRQWNVQITRASAAISSGSVSLSGTATTGQVLASNISGFNAVPTPVKQYSWAYADDPDGPWITFSNAPNRIVVPRSVTGKVLRLEVGFYNDYVDSAGWSAATAPVTAAPLAAPTAVSARSQYILSGGGGLTVTWTPPVDSEYTGSTVTATAGASTKTCSTGVRNPACTLQGLTIGTEYTITVVSHAGVDNGLVDSLPSSPITATPVAHTQPTMGTVSITGTPTAGERLTANVADLTGTPTPDLFYTWQYSTSGTGEWTNFVDAGSQASFILPASAVGKYVHVLVRASTGGPELNTYGTSSSVGPILASDVIRPDFDFQIPGGVGFGQPRDVAFDSDGYMYVTSEGGGLYKFAPNSPWPSFAPVGIWNTGDDGTTIKSRNVVVDSHDNVWVIDPWNSRIWELPAGSTTATPMVSRVYANSPQDGFAIDANDYIYVVDHSDSTVKVFAPGVRYGDAPVRSLSPGGTPREIAIDADGNVVVAVDNIGLRFFTPGASGSSAPIRTILQPSGCYLYGVTVDANGRIYTSSRNCQFSYVYERNATADVAPIKTLPNANDNWGGMVFNPLNGAVYNTNLYQGRIVGWQLASLNLGPAQVEGVPVMTTVTTATTGEVAVRGVLTASFGGLTGLPAPTLTKHWQVANSAFGPWSNIAGETANSIDLDYPQQGKYLRFAVTVENINGATTTASAPVGPVAARPTLGVDRWIRGSATMLTSVDDIEFLNDDRLAVATGDNNGIRIFSTEADGNTAPSALPVPTGGVYNPWGLSVAPDGSIWGAYVNYGMVKIPANSDGVATPTRSWSLGRPFRVVEDDNGYLYVSQLESRKVLVFAPGAGAGSSPIRTLDVWARGLVMDIHGDLVTASDGYLRVFEPGASTNNLPIKQVNINGNANDIGVDSEKRIWVIAEGKVKIYNPELQNQSVPVLQSTADWANKLTNPENLAVSRTTPGLFAVSTYSNGVRTYDWSSIIPDVPTASAPHIASARIEGDYRIAGTLTATPGALTGYPDGVLTYKWQTSDSASGPWSDIAGVTDATYQPVLGDTYKYLRAAITITNSEGTDTAYSAGTSKLGHGYVRSPSSYIGGSQTKLTTDPWVLRRLANGNILVANRYGNVSEFAAGASFNAAPIREISVAGYQNPSGLSVNKDGTIWISYENSKVVKVAADAGLNATPLQTIDPTCRVGSVVQDSNGFIYAPCWNLTDVLVFAGDADVNSAPVRRIPGVLYGYSVRIDPLGNVAVPSNGGYRTFAAGGAGTSNDPIISKDMYTHVRDVTWDNQGNAIFAVSDGFWIFRADFSNYVNSGTPPARVWNDGWSNFGDWGASVEFDPTNNQIISPRQGGTPQINFWNLSAALAGDPVQPGAPLNVDVTEGDQSLVVTWEAPTGVVDDYTVTITGGAEPFTCTTEQLTCSFDSQDGVVNSVTYNVVVTARASWLSTDAGGVSAMANPQPPQPVTNVRTSFGNRTFTITWNAAPGEVTNYVVTATGGASPMVCTTTSTTCTFGQLDGVVNYLDYSVTIKTVRRSVFALTDPITIAAGLPGKVTGVTATGLDGQIVVNWAVPVGIITSFTASAVSGGTTLMCGRDTASATSCTISGATNGSTYSVSVVAFRGESAGTASDTVQATVNQTPDLSNFTVAGTLQSGKTLRVSGLSVVGFPTPTVAYQWQSSATNSGPWLNVDTTTATYDLMKPDVGRYLRVVVTATNGIGVGDRQVSNVLGPILNLSGGTENVAQPITGFRGVAGDEKVTLSWDQVKGVTADTYTITITGGGPKKTVVVSGTLLTKVVTGLDNGTTYKFSVVATGHSESLSRVIEEMPIGLLGKVTKVSAVVNVTTLTLKWTRPAGTSPVAAYRVVLNSLTKGAPDVEAVATSPSVTIAKLVKGASYRLTITGRNSLGLGTVYTHTTVIKVAK